MHSWELGGGKPNSSTSTRNGNRTDGSRSYQLLLKTMTLFPSVTDAANITASNKGKRRADERADSDLEQPVTPKKVKKAKVGHRVELLEEAMEMY